MSKDGTKEYDFKFKVSQCVLFLLHTGAALTLGLYAHHNDKDWKTKVFFKYNAWISNSTQDGCDGGCGILEVKEETGGPDVSLAWAAASFSLISALHHLFALLSFDSHYKQLIENGVIWPRWLDYAFSSGLMFVIIGILFTSPPDLTFIVSLRYMSKSQNQFSRLFPEFEV